jgi:hypothetical protein
MKSLIFVILALCLPLHAQTINPSQIRPSATNGQVVTTVGGKTQWSDSALPPGAITAVTATAPLDCTTSGSSVNCSMAQATSSVDGYLSHIDWAAFNAKQNALSLLPGTYTNGDMCTYASSGTLLNCNTAIPTVGTWGALNYPTWASGTPFVKMTAPGTFALDTNTYGTFTLPSLTSGSVLYSNGSTIAQDNSNFFWDATNHRLGIGTTAPGVKLDVAGQIRATYAGYPILDLEGGALGNTAIRLMRIGTTYSAGTGNDFWIGSITDGSGNPRNTIYTGQGLVPLVLQESGGNVGIGTTSPAALLSVGSSSQFQVSSTGVSSAGAGSTDYSTASSAQVAHCLADGTGGGVCPASATQTTVSCSTAGTATFSEPFTGTSYKKVIYSVSGCQGTVSYTFPVAFTVGTTQLSQAGGTNTVTNTGITWASVSALTAIGVIEGW